MPETSFAEVSAPPAPSVRPAPGSGEIARRSFELYFVHFAWWVALALPLLLALSLWQTHVTGTPATGTDMSGFHAGEILPAALATFVVYVFLTLPLALAADASERGREVDVRATLRTSVALLPRALWVLFRGTFLVGLAALAFFVPGVVVQTRLALAPAIVALEPEAPRPLSRSWSLTRGRALQTFGVLLLTAIPWWLATILAFTVAEISRNAIVDAIAGAASDLPLGVVPIASVLLYRAYAGRSAGPAVRPTGDAERDVTVGRFE